MKGDRISARYEAPGKTLVGAWGSPGALMTGVREFFWANYSL